MNVTVTETQRVLHEWDLIIMGWSFSVIKDLHTGPQYTIFTHLVPDDTVSNAKYGDIRQRRNARI